MEEASNEMHSEDDKALVEKNKKRILKTPAQVEALEKYYNASNEMHSEDDKALVEKNKKRILKTPAQVEALEKYYNEHKYPTEAMKLQLAESIGLTEKQVSGWFCHRRLRDKRLMINGDNNIILRQDRSSGVIQDGHRQDSCGSTKQGDDWKFGTGEAENGRLNHLNCSGNRNRMGDASSGSSSPLRSMSNDHEGEDPFEVPTSRIPKHISVDAKTRWGPSGYLKVKAQVENGAITAVKRQLGKHYREDGPPLGVDFDPLPPGAFESLVQDPVDGTRYSGEAVPPASPDISKYHQYPKFGRGCEYNSTMASRQSNMIRTSSKVPSWSSDIPDNSLHKKFKQNISLSNNGGYYPGTNSYVELPEACVSEGRDDNRMRYRTSFWKSGEEQVLSSHKYNIENGPSNMTLTGLQYQNPYHKMQHRDIVKDGKGYAERRTITENRVMTPCASDIAAPKRARDVFPYEPYT